MRYFLVAFAGERFGNLWFKMEGFPSNSALMKTIKDMFPQVQNPCIINIQELSEEDFNENIK